MHILMKVSVIAAVLAGIGLVALAIYFLPIIAVLVFLCCVVLVWFIRVKQGESKRAWKELVKSLFLDW